MLNKISHTSDNQERINALKDICKDGRVFIVAPGPSLLTHSRDKILSRLENETVITLKQAYDYVKEVTDIHCMSVYNYQDYEYVNDDTIRHWQLTAVNIPGELQRINQWGHRIDVMMPVFSTPWIQKHQSTSYTREFTNWELYGQGKAVWGPGIIYESGFPLALHMGAKEIVTIGWDIGDLSKYGDLDVDPNWTDQHAKELYKIDTGGGPEREELENTISCTEALNSYLESRGVKLKICSDTNPAHESIERISFENI